MKSLIGKIDMGYWRSVQQQMSTLVDGTDLTEYNSRNVFAGDNTLPKKYLPLIF
ncbi:MAG TPA: hypothetical protein VF691_12495 [Cytophagaceae bacterium]